MIVPQPQWQWSDHTCGASERLGIQKLREEIHYDQCIIFIFPKKIRVVHMIAIIRACRAIQKWCHWKTLKLMVDMFFYCFASVIGLRGCFFSILPLYRSWLLSKKKYIITIVASLVSTSQVKQVIEWLPQFTRLLRRNFREATNFKVMLEKKRTTTRWFWETNW